MPVPKRDKLKMGVEQPTNGHKESETREGQLTHEAKTNSHSSDKGSARNPHGNKQLDLQGDVKGYSAGHYEYGSKGHTEGFPQVKTSSAYGKATGQKRTGKK